MELYKVETCRAISGCPRAVTDLTEIAKTLEEIFQITDFPLKRKKALGDKAKQHNIFKACLAGCANCCSQPQIKDFSLVALVYPNFTHELCNLCGLCCTTCKEEGLRMEKGKLIFDKEKCLGCGDCWRICPKGAINKEEQVQWRLMLGGKLGRHPQIAREVGKVSRAEAQDYFKKALSLVLEKNPHERFADLLKTNNL